MAESLRAHRSPMLFGKKVERGEPKEPEGISDLKLSSYDEVPLLRACGIWIGSLSHERIRPGKGFGGSRYGSA